MTSQLFAAATHLPGHQICPSRPRATYLLPTHLVCVTDRFFLILSTAVSEGGYTSLTLAGSCSFVKQLRAISAQNKNEEERSGVTRFRSLDRLTAMTRSFYWQSRSEYSPIWTYMYSEILVP